MHTAELDPEVARHVRTPFDQAVRLMRRQPALPEQAEPLLLQLLATTPHDVPAWHLLQRSLRLQWRFDEALAAAQRGLTEALAQLPLRAELVAAMHEACSQSLADLGQPAAALVEAYEALALAPENGDFKRQLAQALLLGGDWPDGFALYCAARVAQPGLLTPVTGEPPWPLWRGEVPAADDALLVIADQELGDTLQFVRGLLALRDRFARVTLLCQPDTQRLLQHSLGPCVECVALAPDLVRERNTPSWQWHVPLLSLPAILAYTPQTLPACVPYLFTEPRSMRAWGERLAQHEAALGGRRLRVGLVWADQPRPHLPDMERRRSVALRLLAPLLARTDVLWLSLQQGASRLAELADLDVALRPLPWSAKCRDLAETAALAANLDLIISADSSVAHLLGAMGRPVWLLNRFESEWRWLWRREDSPWYPTMRIFSQTRFGDWANVVDRVDRALDALQRARVRCDPTNAARALQASAEQREAGRLEQAEEACRLALTLAPQWAQAHFRLGTVLRERGRPGQAEASFRQALCLQTDSADAAGSLAQLLLAQGRCNEAEVYACQVLGCPGQRWRVV